MRTITLVVALLAGFVGAPAFAASPAAAPNDAAAAAEDESAGWLKRLEEARARLDTATRRLTALGGIKGRGAHRRYPRGDAKEKYLEDLEAARKEYNEAERALPELIEEARRAGIPPGVLARYEEPAEPDESDAINETGDESEAAEEAEGVEEVEENDESSDS